MTGWLRSSFCSGNGECIEVTRRIFTRAIPENLGIWFGLRRDGRGEIWVRAAEWDAFIAGVKAGDFDHLEETP